MAPSTTEVAVKWTLEDGWEAAASSELLGASVLTADELARYTFFTRVRVETRSGTFELERGQDGLAPRLSCAGGKFGSGGHWLVKCVDILLNEDDEEPRIAFRYLYPAHELPASGHARPVTAERSHRHSTVQLTQGTIRQTDRQVFHFCSD